MRKDRKLQIRYMRCICYVTVFLAALFLTLFLRSYFLLTVMVLLLLWPGISVAGAGYLARGITARIGTGQARVCRGDTVLITFQIQNRSWWLALDAEWKIRIENSLWGERSEQRVSMPVRLHGDENLTLPLQMMNLGHFCFCGERLMVQDIMGLVRVQIPLALTGEVDVIPEDGSCLLDETEGYMSGLSETEESKEKGSDFAEVSDIREYAPGDRIRDIHWKLSAKKDILMVKERVSVAGSEMAFMLQPGEQKEPAEQVLVHAFHLAQAFLAQRVPVCLILWNQNLYEWEEWRFASEEELKESYCKLYLVPVSVRNNGEWELYMRNCYPHLGNYLVIGMREGEIQVMLHENA